MKKYIHIVILTLALFTLASCGHEHTPAVDNAVAPTCIATGLTEGSHCSECGEVLTAQEEVAKTEHSAVADSAVAPTCTVTGLTEGAHCSECGEVITEQAEIAKLEHTAVVDKAVAPTCAATGLTEGSHCSECGEVLTAQEEVAKSEHTAVVDNAVAPTCATTGLTEGSHCSECGEVLTAQEEVAKTEHTAVVDKAVSATCTSTGKTEGSHCSVCNTVLVVQQITNKTDHSYTITYDKSNHTKTCVYCEKAVIERHSLNSSNQCSCGYKEIVLSATQDAVTRIAKNDVSVFNEMTNLTTANGWLERTSYSEITGVTSWGKTVNWNDTARVRNVEFLDTSGFTMVVVNDKETIIEKSYILLESNTTDPKGLMPLVGRDLQTTNNLYAKMNSEIAVALDTFLSTIGEHTTTDFVVRENGEFVSKGGNNALSNLKNKINDMTTFAKREYPFPTLGYEFGSDIVVETSTVKYTITVSLCNSINNSNVKALRMAIKGERIS